MRVLVASQDVPLLEALQSFLWDCGHEAEIAESALECATILQDFCPEVVVIVDELLWGGVEGLITVMRQDAALATTRLLFFCTSDCPRSHWTSTQFRLSLSQLASYLEDADGQKSSSKLHCLRQSNSNLN